MPQKNALSDNHLLGHPVHIEYRLLVSFLHSPLPLIVHPEQGDMSSSILARQTWRRWGNVLCYSVTPRNNCTLCVPKRDIYTLCAPTENTYNVCCVPKTVTQCVSQRNNYTVCSSKKQLHTVFCKEAATLHVPWRNSFTMCLTQQNSSNVCSPLTAILRVPKRNSITNFVYLRGNSS